MIQMRLRPVLLGALFTVIFQTALSGDASYAKAHPAKIQDANYRYIKAAYDYQSYGYNIKDVNRIYSYTTSDFTIHGLDGNIYTKQQCLRGGYQLLQTLYTRENLLDLNGTISRQITIHSFRVSGYQAVVIENEYAKLKVASSRVEMTPIEGGAYVGTFQDVWVRNGRGWLEQSSTILREGRL